jgi:hypothetical protein
LFFLFPTEKQYHEFGGKLGCTERRLTIRTVLVLPAIYEDLERGHSAVV